MKKVIEIIWTIIAFIPMLIFGYMIGIYILK